MDDNNRESFTKEMRRNLVRQSKFLSLVLRHNPSAIGIELDDSGWVDVSILLDALRVHRREITLDRLVEIVETNDKKRFAFSEDRKRIRASQGHSIGVDLDLPAAKPPDALFHGTAESNLPSIRENGIIRGKRDHVHLSLDEITATKVGSRHGKPVVLRIESGRMAEAGFVFFLSENNVWLTEKVPPDYIDFTES